jgi:hypothetical protein
MFIYMSRVYYLYQVLWYIVFLFIGNIYIESFIIKIYIHNKKSMCYLAYILTWMMRTEDLLM